MGKFNVLETVEITRLQSNNFLILDLGGASNRAVARTEGVFRIYFVHDVIHSLKLVLK